MQTCAIHERIQPMLRWKWFGLLTLSLLLAACGSNQQTTAPSGSTSGTMAGMDHTTMTAMPTMAAAAPTSGAMSGMDTSATPGMAMGDSSVPYDALFIDSMIMHHQGAIDMANQA